MEFSPRSAKLSFHLSWIWIVAHVALIPAVVSASCLDQPLSALIRSGQILNQKDERLFQAGLLGVPGGGLCGSTCAYNLLRAVQERGGVALRNFVPEPGQELVATYRQFAARQVDIRKGMNLGMIEEYLRSRLPGSMTIGKMYPSETAITIKHIDFPGRASILGLIWDDPRMPQGLAGHAVLVRRVDRDRNKIFVVDPNYPDRELSLTYRAGVKVGSRTTLGFKPDYSYPGFEIESGTVQGFVYVDLPPLLTPKKWWQLWRR